MKQVTSKGIAAVVKRNRESIQGLYWLSPVKSHITSAPNHELKLVTRLQSNCKAKREIIGNIHKDVACVLSLLQSFHSYIPLP